MSVKAWWILLAVVVPGGSLLTLAVWLRKRWLAREAAQIAQAIAAQRKALYYTYVGHDEGVDLQSRIRRDVAGRMRRRAAAVVSGSTSAEVLKIVTKA